MSESPPIYDLVLVLDPLAEDGARAKIVADARSAIEAGGELLRHDEWGERPLAYPIDHHASGEYHLLQFHAGAPELLGSVDRMLRITDGILRFRIIKLRRGVPEAPDMRSPAASAARRAEAEPGARAEVVVEAEPQEPPPPPAETEPALGEPA